MASHKINLTETPILLIVAYDDIRFHIHSNAPNLTSTHFPNYNTIRLDKASAPHVMLLPEDSQDLYDLYIQWEEQGGPARIDTMPDLSKAINDRQVTLVMLNLPGERLLDRKLRNAIVGGIVAENEETCPSPVDIGIVYRRSLWDFRHSCCKVGLQPLGRRDFILDVNLDFMDKFLRRAEKKAMEERDGGKRRKRFKIVERDEYRRKAMWNLEDERRRLDRIRKKNRSLGLPDYVGCLDRESGRGRRTRLFTIADCQVYGGEDVSDTSDDEDGA